jgi:hypothetical protein
MAVFGRALSAACGVRGSRRDHGAGRDAARRSRKLEIRNPNLAARTKSLAKRWQAKMSLLGFLPAVFLPSRSGRIAAILHHILERRSETNSNDRKWEKSATQGRENRSQAGNSVGYSSASSCRFQVRRCGLNGEGGDKPGGERRGACPASQVAYGFHKFSRIVSHTRGQCAPAGGGKHPSEKE